MPRDRVSEGANMLRRYRRLGRLPALLLVVPLALPSVAFALGPDDLPQLTALEDRVAATLAAPELNWSSDGAYLIASGRSPAGAPLTFVIPVDGRPAIALPDLVSPRLAIAPTGSRIACWLRGPTGPQGAEMARLAVFDPQAGSARAIEGLAPFETPSPVVWTEEPERIVALRPRPDYTALVVLVPATGQPAPLVATVAGLGTVLRCAATPGMVTVGTVGADGQTEYFLVDVVGGVISNVPPEEASGALAQAVGRATSHSPSGTLLATCRSDGLWAGPPAEPFTRKLLPRGDAPAHPFVAASQPLWSPADEHLAYAISSPGQAVSDVHLVTLGLEEITCQVTYPIGTTPPPLGTTVWVCMALQTEAGKPTEPDWKTLKAQLSVTSSPLPSAQGIGVRARSTGLDPGVLKRLTGLSEPPSDTEDASSLKIGLAAGAQQTVLRAFDLSPRGGLLAWSQDGATGQVVAVTVTRRALLLFGAPAP